MTAKANIYSGKPVNLGCGCRIRRGWLNLDLNSNLSEVICWDLRQGLPVENDAVPFVYTSHMLEHLTPSDAERILRDVHRALRPEGIARIVVPDLASLARWYVQAFERAREDSNELEWARIQLFDQMVRGENGGRMLEFLRNASEEELMHATALLGPEVGALGRSAPLPPRSLSQRLASSTRPRLLARALARARLTVARGVVAALLGRRGREAFKIALFATTGERHLWMYDVHNLSALLRRCGFGRVEKQTPQTSLWPSWTRENLDVEDDGRETKPNSLYLEGVKH
jgi:predicted SAM-dependent methyltransferase